jgi:hypothetical protein
MSHTRQDGSPEDPVKTRMVEIRPHVYVSENFARANGMNRHIPSKPATKPAEASETKGKPC